MKNWFKKLNKRATLEENIRNTEAGIRVRIDRIEDDLLKLIDKVTSDSNSTINELRDANDKLKRIIKNMADHPVYILSKEFSWANYNNITVPASLYALYLYIDREEYIVRNIQELNASHDYIEHDKLRVENGIAKLMLKDSKDGKIHNLTIDYVSGKYVHNLEK